MNDRNQTKVLLALVFFTVAMLSCGQLWAQDCTGATPSVTTNIINENTKVVSACDGTPIAVYFRDNVDAPWVEAQPQQGYICICEEFNGDCNLTDETGVLCYPIKQAGAGTQGCVVSKNPRTYLFGGDAYTSSR